ncbi:hypothetical protein TUN199_02102 [Pyrenophora tritici-repentis]|nr:hypothetical protein TUN205_04422 [Pyrenophora tritici-repentis]KAI0625918.1 hypothetical protein TUN199_02102 [Pyrenophora tritici-repentis]
MSTERPDPIFCTKIGDTNPNTPNELQCCSPNTQNSTLCRSIFSNPLNSDIFTGTCFAPGHDCLADCQHPRLIYSSKVQDDYEDGNGSAPKNRYLACVNVPNMAGYLRQDVLGPNITSQVEPHISRNATKKQLQGISYAVTECLAATCRNSRKPGKCKKQCSGVSLLWNQTTPDIQGIDQCLDTLCQAAPADTEPPLSPLVLTTTPPIPKTKRSHRRNLLILLIQFHKSQCYFSATVQTASFTFGIFNADMLNVFLLLPLTTNGILPIVLAYILLIRHHKATPDITVLTTICWILASVVYWILYSHVIPINGEIQNKKANYSAYEQFMYKLSALEACGGYSALAVCPQNFLLGKDEIVRASWRLRTLTPLIWAVSSALLFVAVGSEVMRWRSEGKYHAVEQEAGVKEGGQRGKEVSKQGHGTRSLFANRVVYGIVSVASLAGLGMQLSLLSVSLSLKMTDALDWTFGQIVAIAIWTPPLLGYVYDEAKTFMPERFREPDELD